LKHHLSEPFVFSQEFFSLTPAPPLLCCFSDFPAEPRASLNGSSEFLNYVPAVENEAGWHKWVFLEENADREEEPRVDLAFLQVTQSVTGTLILLAS
jgi:hypothetical protein